MTKNLVKKLPANVEGRDFVIGDLHGCYDEVLKLLGAVDFDTNKDRLISTGDLMDRGPKSIECVDLLNYDWFHCVRGNHEEILLYKSSMIENNDLQSLKNFTSDELRYLNTFTAEMLEKISNLPYILDIEHILHDRYYIVHAEFLPEHLLSKNISYEPKKYSEVLNNFQNVDSSDKVSEFIDNYQDTDDNKLKQKLVWSRKIVGKFYEDNKDSIANFDFSFLKEKMNNKYKIFCGHNVVPFPIKIGQQFYLDTGAALGYAEKTVSLKVFSNFGHEFFGLSMLDVGTGEVYQCITNEDKRGRIIKMKKSLYDR